MKGLLVSLIAVAMALVMSATLGHWLRPKRYLPLFFACVLAAGGAYVAIYALTPPNIWCLPIGWVCMSPSVDFAYGLVVYLLNSHTWVDVFYATCGGFSTALLVEMRRAKRPLETKDIAQKFRAGNSEDDRIYAWRIPNLQKHGLLSPDGINARLALTRKGKFVAKIALFLKKAMNLSAGG